jgi:hypothetical protein
MDSVAWTVTIQILYKSDGSTGVVPLPGPSMNLLDFNEV